MLSRTKKQEKKASAGAKEETMDKCLCTECPTNPDLATVYCERGITSKTPENVRALGCSCAFCPVYHECKLSGCYLCLNPRETEKSS